MRVMVIHNRYRSTSASGENAVAEQEIALLRSAGHEVVTYERESDEINGFSLPRKALVPASVIWSQHDHRALRRVLRSTKPDVAHVHNTFPLISPAAIHACGSERVPVVTTLHNYRLICANGLLFRDGAPCERCVGHSPWSGVLYACYRGSRTATFPIALNIATHRLFGTWVKGVSRFVVLSDFARRTFAASGLPESKLRVKPNFVPRPDRVRSDAGESILYLGRLSAEKGVDLLLESGADSRLDVLIVGDGPERQALTAMAARRNAPAQFLGHLPRDRCLDLLRRARMLILPSRVYEGFPIAILEAYAHGVPVIAPSHGPFPEIVENERTGMLFEPGNARDLAAKIQALQHEDVSHAMGDQARRRYEERYTPERSLELLMDIYGEAVSGSRRPDRS
jgi:glycosyltransferase involved in cell wall biosynthesis